MVDWEEDYYFSLVATVAVPTVENIDQAFGGDLNIEHFGPYEVGAAGTENARARMTVFVPPHTCTCFWEED